MELNNQGPEDSQRLAVSFKLVALRSLPASSRKVLCKGLG